MKKPTDPSKLTTTQLDKIANRYSPPSSNTEAFILYAAQAELKVREDEAKARTSAPEIPEEEDFDLYEFQDYCSE